MNPFRGSLTCLMCVIVCVIMLSVRGKLVGGIDDMLESIDKL